MSIVFELLLVLAELDLLLKLLLLAQALIVRATAPAIRHPMIAPLVNLIGLLFAPGVQYGAR